MASTASTLFPSTITFGKTDAWFDAVPIATQLVDPKNAWTGADIETAKKAEAASHKPIGPGAPYIVDADGKRVYDAPIEAVDTTGAPVAIVDAMIPAPAVHVPHNLWGSLTLSTGVSYSKDESVPIVPTMGASDFALAVAHNKFVGKGKKIAASKARRSATEKADEDAANKEAAEKAASRADFARLVAAQKSAAQKPVAAAASSIATTKKASSNTFAALDDSEED